MENNLKNGESNFNFDTVPTKNTFEKYSLNISKEIHKIENYPNQNPIISSNENSTRNTKSFISFFQVT